MPDESGSFLAKFIAHAGPKYARKGTAANAVAIGIGLPVSYFVINIAPMGIRIMRLVFGQNRTRTPK